MDIKAWNAKSESFNFKKAKINYVRAGKGAALVLIHGFPTSSWDFSWIFPELIKKFDCICADLIGLGRSSTSAKTITIADQADALEALLKKLGISQAHLFAHDLGDTVATELLYRSQQGNQDLQWLSCTLMNGGVFQETNKPRYIQKLLNSPIGFLIGRFSSKHIYVKTIIKIFGKNTPPSAEFLNDSWNIFIENKGRKMLPIVGRYLTERKIHKARWEQPLFSPSLPMAMINGVWDPISGEATADRFEEKVSGSYVVRLPLGHYPHIENPKAVLDAFYAFHARL